MAKTFPLAVVIAAVDRLSGPLLQMGGKLSQFGDRAASIGAGMSLAVTAPVLGFFTLATRQALETERAMERLRSTSRGTAEELAAAARAAGQVPGDFDPHEGFDALTQMGKLGLALSDSLAALPAATNLAIATESDLADTSRRLIQVLRAYGLELHKTAALSDLLAQANAQSDLGLGGVADQLARLAPLARLAGLDVSQTAAAIIELGRAGQEPAAVLRASLAALLKPSAAAAQALARLKIKPGDLFDADGEFLGLIRTIELLEQRGASAADLLDIFGKRAGPGMAALLQLGQKGLSDTSAELFKVGAAAEQARRRLRGTEGAIWNLDNRMEDLNETIARSGLLENLSMAVETLANLARGLNDIDPRIISVGVSVATVVAILGPAIWLVGKLASGVSLLATAWTGLTAALAPAAAALGLPAAAIAGIAVALGAAARVVYEFRHQIGEALQDFADWVTDSKVFQALEWFATLGGVLDLRGVKAQAERDRALTEDLRDAGPGGERLGRDALHRAAEINRMVAAANGQGEVLVRFEGAPRGTSAKVLKSAGLDLGVDVGWAGASD